MLSFSTYRSKRRFVQALSTIIIIVLPFLNVLRLDIPTLRFYFLSSVLWVDEFYLLFLVMMLILWIIVIFSMVYGRVWCGWICPQMVLNELSGWLEKKTDRWLRISRTSGRPDLSARRLAGYALVSAAISAVALLIGFNLVAYFTDPYRMLADLLTGRLGSVESGFIVGIAILVYVDVMFWREKFCTRACPYGMMQIVVTDANTQVVRYQRERAHECIDCMACVRDCMMGIDLRTSPYQTECIHCGDCVDLCTAILKRLKKPTLITFSWGGRERGRTWYEKLGLIDAKRWIVLSITAVYAVVLAVLIDARQPLALSATGDGSTLFREGKNGVIWNDYTLTISNRSLNDGAFLIECTGKLQAAGRCALQLLENPVFLKSREVRTIRFSIGASSSHLRPGPNRLALTAVNTSDPNIRAATEVAFFTPQHEWNQLRVR